MTQTQNRSAVDWVESFTLHPKDCEHLASLLLEAATPWSSEQVVLALLQHRLTQDRELQLDREDGDGTADVYRPDRNYESGQVLRFPAMDDMLGEVISVRDGFNPSEGDFRVIAVACDDESTREFASALPEHALNTEALAVADAAKESVDRCVQLLLREHGVHLHDKIANDLLASGEIVRLAGYWFPRDLLVEISTGHLNLVEAALDVAGGGPLTPEDILLQLGTITEVDPQLMLFSLNYALQQDERFDEVGPAGKVLWFLRSMQPKEIVFPPDWLRCILVEEQVHVLTPELEQLARSLSDEFSPPTEAQVNQGPVDLVLTYPHRRAGTIPLGSRMAHIFPSAFVSPRITITLIDELSGQHLPGWVVPSERFVLGFGSLYEKYSVPPGARITLLSGDVANETVVRIHVRNPISEWVRTVSATPSELRFAMSKREIGVSYAEEQIIAVDDVNAVEAASQRLRENGTTLEQTVLSVFRELVNLTPQGTVHAKTLYSAVNVAWRVPPEPVFAELMHRSYYRHVGDAYWRYDQDAKELADD